MWAPMFFKQILWPDGIFISKHPKRRPPPSTNSSQNSPHGRQPPEISSPRLSDEQQQEAIRRAKFVYELMIGNIFCPACSLFLSSLLTPYTNVWLIFEIQWLYVLFLNVDNAPAAIVGLVGRREYEQCAKDLYFFIQVLLFLILWKLQFYMFTLQIFYMKCSLAYANLELEIVSHIQI